MALPRVNNQLTPVTYYLLLWVTRRTGLISNFTRGAFYATTIPVPGRVDVIYEQTRFTQITADKRDGIAPSAKDARYPHRQLLLAASEFWAWDAYMDSSGIDSVGLSEDTFIPGGTDPSRSGHFTIAEKSFGAEPINIVVQFGSAALAQELADKLNARLG